MRDSLNRMSGQRQSSVLGLVGGNVTRALSRPNFDDRGFHQLEHVPHQFTRQRILADELNSKTDAIWKQHGAQQQLAPGVVLGDAIELIGADAEKRFHPRRHEVMMKRVAVCVAVIDARRLGENDGELQPFRSTKRLIAARSLILPIVVL